MRTKLQKLSLAAASAVPFLVVQPATTWSNDKEVPPCKAQPRDQGPPPKIDGSSGRSRLGDCNGILHPPAVGDPELVKPAPNVGNMPVIPPDSVPKNAGNGSGQNEPQ